MSVQVKNYLEINNFFFMYDVWFSFDVLFSNFKNIKLVYFGLNLKYEARARLIDFLIVTSINFTDSSLKLDQSHH
jgi:hypothetical protein